MVVSLEEGIVSVAKLGRRANFSSRVAGRLIDAKSKITLTMSPELTGIAASKSRLLKKYVPDERKALRMEMSLLYGKIASSVRRRNATAWQRA